MAINHWPKDERPREKLLKRGANALSDAELLAIFLRTGVAGSSAVDLARRVIGDFGSLSAVFAANFSEFCAKPGLGVAKYAQLQAALEISCRHLQEKLERGAILSSPQMMQNYLLSRLRRHKREVFAVVLLDTKMRVVLFEELFFGTLDGARVYPREVVKKALEHNARFVVVAHNHPSGNPEPSQADKYLTGHLSDALALMEIELLDHFIIADNQVVSLAELGAVPSAC